MANQDKSVPQLNEKTTLLDDDYFHIIRNNIDYKVKYSNVINESVGLIPITYTDAQTLITNLTLVDGRFYLITDKADAGIILQATSNSSFSIKGTAFYFVPDFQNSGLQTGNIVGVWYSGLAGLTPNISIVIWNGLHYRNLTGNAGSSPSGDVVNWLPLAKTLANGYILEGDELLYKFSSDTPVVRSDKRGNVFNVSSSFQWGNDLNTGNSGEKCTGLTCINQRGELRENNFNSLFGVSITNANEGIIQGCSFNTGPAYTLTTNLNAGTFAKSCVFNFIGADTAIDPTLLYTGLIMDFDTQYNVPINGGTVSFTQSTKKMILNPAGLIAGATINLCDDIGSLYDGKLVSVTSTNIITTVTWGTTQSSASISGAPVSLTNAGVSFVYIKAYNTYYRIG